MKLSVETKQRLQCVIDLGKTVFHWGFIPTVLYLGGGNKHGKLSQRKDSLQLNANNLTHFSNNFENKGSNKVQTKAHQKSLLATLSGRETSMATFLQRCEFKME